MFYLHYIKKIQDLHFNEWLVDDLTPEELARWWSHVTVLPSGCWEWNSRLIVKGKPPVYGSFRVRGRNIPAHRLAYAIFHHPLPASSETRKIVVDHLCKHKPCCNPAHLEMVSQQVNAERAMTFYVGNRHLYTRSYYNYAVSDERNTRRRCTRVTAKLRAQPDAKAHNLSYLANRMLSVALDLPLPETREESRARGGRTGGRGRKREDSATPDGE